jgi:hypothetical protein
LKFRHRVAIFLSAAPGYGRSQQRLMVSSVRMISIYKLRWYLDRTWPQNAWTKSQLWCQTGALRFS